MPFRPANLVHTDEAALAESTPSDMGNGSPEPGPLSSAVERRVHIADVVGSIPTVATIPYVEWVPRRGAQPAAVCSVYAIGDGGPLIKIGMSSRPEKRLSSIRTSSSTSVRVLQSWRLTTRDGARALEKCLHALFNWARKRGEWYELEQRWVSEIVRMLLAGSDVSDICAALGRSWRAAMDADHLIKRREQLNRRWDREERETLATEIGDLLRASNRHYDEALRLGFPPDSFDIALARPGLRL